jgi:hypothetical protein
MKKHTINELNELFNEADSVDQELRAEQRTNLLLVAGEHYNRNGTRQWNRLRDSKQLSSEIKIRITENHLAKITSTYRNAILNQAPGVRILPHNESELHDQKVAEMHTAVWNDLKVRHNIKTKIRLWAKDYVELGEVFCKVYFDPDAGTQIGWEQAVDEAGAPITDQMGQPVSSGVPIMTGDMAFELIHGFDVFRDATGKHFDDCSFIGYQKMGITKELKEKYKNDPEKLKFVEESSKSTFRVFDNRSLQSMKSKGQTLIREYYFRKCAQYPNGYFYITTENGILEEGEIPFGIFPIIYETFEESTTEPRGYSKLRQLRPTQIEINRMVSKIAEHHLTVGDTKVFLVAGSRPGSSVDKPGIRYERITGGAPVVVPGQAGDQFITHLDKKIATLYQLADLQVDEDNIPPQVEPYTLLFRSIRNKKKFSLYSDKFVGFLTNVCSTTLAIFKKSANDQLLINAVGKNEQVNIPEFKSTDDIGWEITPEESTDDLESVFGKQMTINTIIQYTAKQLEKEDLGKLIRLSPYLNKEKMFEDMTMPFDNATNDILALDRGEYPPSIDGEDHKYLLKRLTHRTKQADFRFKPEEIRMLYAQKINEQRQAIAQELEEIQRAQSGFIPSGGYSVATDFYVASDPNNPEKTKRLRLPSESIDWLVKKLDQQGSTLDAIKQLPTNEMAEIGGMINGQPQEQTEQNPEPSEYQGIM